MLNTNSACTFKFFILISKKCFKILRFLIHIETQKYPPQNANGSLTLGRLYFQITRNKCNEAPLVGAGLQKRDVSRRQNTDINHNAMNL